MSAVTDTTTELGSPFHQSAALDEAHIGDINDAERAPKLAKALQDQPGMADTGDGPKAQHHFLIDVEHRDGLRSKPLSCRCHD